MILIVFIPDEAVIILLLTEVDEVLVVVTVALLLLDAVTAGILIKVAPLLSLTELVVEVDSCMVVIVVVDDVADTVTVNAGEMELVVVIIAVDAPIVTTLLYVATVKLVMPAVEVVEISSM